ncbi:hypothetical protein [Ruegeria sp. HKCCD7221]|uniref:hypothetical protein n=1 Tax=Ruegeria sp. HKCCD7221 TaxID=2683009 RepID=UPI00148A1212|nr:hypothetical protein [Ruegeria sp. HKCCD7221]
MTKQASPKILYHFPNARPVFVESRLNKAQLRPTTKGGGVIWHDSVYYWWWCFMRLSPTYKRTCEKRGRVRNAMQKQLYTDFGDIFDYKDGRDGFRKWWNFKTDDMPADRGAVLFGYPALDEVRVVEPPANDLGDDALLIAIPLSLRKRQISQQLNRIIQKHHTGKRGQRYNKNISARYIPLHDKVAALKSAYAALEYRRQNPDAKLWEITQNTGISSYQLSDDEQSKQSAKTVVDAKAYMSTHASRVLKKAEAIVAGVDQGVFPKS